MTSRELHRSVKDQPFVPFRIRMADGRLFEVRHPDFVFVYPGVRTFVFLDYAEKTHRILDARHVQELEYDIETDDAGEVPLPAAA